MQVFGGEFELATIGSDDYNPALRGLAIAENKRCFTAQYAGSQLQPRFTRFCNHECHSVTIAPQAERSAWG